MATVIEEARASHSLHHQYATALRYQFHIPRETAREIVRSCLYCPTVYNSLPMGVNPRGLKPNVLWQMDVIHCPELSPSSFLHVCIDTNSSFIWATPLYSEAT